MLYRTISTKYCLGPYPKHLASRLAKKASKSHKRNISEFNDLMEKLPVHNEQRKINWYKF